MLKLRQHSVKFYKNSPKCAKVLQKSKDHKKLKFKTCLFIKISDQTIKEKNNNTSKKIVAKQNILLLSNKKKIRNSEKKNHFFVCRSEARIGLIIKRKSNKKNHFLCWTWKELFFPRSENIKLCFWVKFRWQQKNFHSFSKHNWIIKNKSHGISSFTWKFVSLN